MGVCEMATEAVDGDHRPGISKWASRLGSTELDWLLVERHPIEIWGARSSCRGSLTSRMRVGRRLFRLPGRELEGELRHGAANDHHGGNRCKQSVL